MKETDLNQQTVPETWLDIEVGDNVSVREPARVPYFAVVDEKMPDSTVIWVTSTLEGRRAHDFRDGVSLIPSQATRPARLQTT